MTEPSVVTQHVLRPSIPDTVPPLPGGARVALGYVQGEGADARARLYVRDRPGASSAVRQLDDVRADDRFVLGDLRIAVVAVRSDSVLLSAEACSNA